MKKKIFIYAYTRLNLGDDLFIKILCDRYPYVNFVVVCNLKDSIAFRSIKNILVIPTIPYIDSVFKRIFNKSNINSTMRRYISKLCDGIVHIGGSIYIEQNNWKDKFKEYEKSVLENKPFYIIGSNFGPFKDKEFYFKYKNVFKSVEDVCFREKKTYEIFSDLKNVRQEADIVFSLPSQDALFEKKQAIISVINLSNRDNLKAYKKIYEKRMLELSRVLERRGYSVYLMSFCSNEGDDKVVDRLLLELNDNEKKKILPYYYSGNINEVTTLFKESKMIFATRFHSIVLGLVYNKKVFPVIYSSKSENVLNDIAFVGDYIHIENIVDFDPMSAISTLLIQESTDVTEQKESAIKQFRKLDEFLFNS